MNNAASRKDIRAAEKAAALALIQRREVVTSIMSTMAGRSWLWDRMSETNIFHTTHVQGDALASAFQEGRRSVGLSLLADIMAHCPDQFIAAMREQNERHNSDNRSPDFRADLAAAAAERSGSPITDGGDSGTLADQAVDDGDDPETERRWNPGVDIYAPGPNGQAS